MNEDLKKLKRLRDTIVGLEMELSIVEQDLIVVTSDLNYLHEMENTLLENLKILKKEKVIAMASQYKKSINELEDVRSAIRKRVNVKINLDRRLEIAVRRHKTYTEDHDRLLKAIKQEKVVLFFDQRKRRKKK